jgi:hypothetical protein
VRIALARSIALTGEPRGIHCNVVAPGYVVPRCFATPHGRTEAGGDGAVRSPGHRPGDSLCYVVLRSNESPYVNATLFFNGLRFCGIVGSRQLKCGLLRSRSRSGHRIVIRVSLLHELRRRPNRWIFSVLIILLVEQNARRALAASQRAYVLEQGRIAFSGSNRDARRPRVIAHYLGV